jgi:hypothetical protein
MLRLLFFLSQYHGTTGYWMLMCMLRLFACLKVTVSWKNRLLDAKAFAKAVICFVKQKDPGTTGHCMPRHMPRLFFCCKKLAVYCNDRPLDDKAYAKAVCCLFKKFSIPGTPGNWVSRHMPRLCFGVKKFAVSWKDGLLGAKAVPVICLFNKNFVS